MPKVSRFQRDRIAKLLGNKTKPIQRQSEKQAENKKEKDNQTPTRKKAFVKQPPTSDKMENCSFKASSYIQMQKVYKVHNRTHQIQKINFRCFEDEQIFGAQQMMNYLKQTHDNDHDTPQEQIKYDISRGVKKLKQELQRKLFESGDLAQSQKPASVKGSVKGTPPGFVGIRFK